MVAEDKLLCLRRSKNDPQLQAMEKIMGMGEKVSVLAANDPALAHAFGPDGLFALMQDPEKMAALPPELQRGMGLFGTAMSSPDLLYTGAPLRVGGRTIGTFCCLFLDRGPEAAFSPAEEVLLKSHAARASEVRAPPFPPPRALPCSPPRAATWQVLTEVADLSAAGVESPPGKRSS